MLDITYLCPCALLPSSKCGFHYLVGVISFVFFWNSIEGIRALSLVSGYGDTLCVWVLINYSFVRVRGQWVTGCVTLPWDGGIRIIIFGLLRHVLFFSFSGRRIKVLWLIYYLNYLLVLIIYLCILFLWKGYIWRAKLGCGWDRVI